jgi:hypothetical protein
MRELAANSPCCSLITDEQSPRSSRIEGKERKRKRAKRDEFPIDGSKSARLEEGRVSSPSDHSPESLLSYSDVTSDEEENIYHNIKEFFSEPNLEGDEAAPKVCSDPSSEELGKQCDIELKNDNVHSLANVPLAIPPRQSIFKEDAEEYLSLTVAKLRRRLLAAQVQMSLLTSPQLQGDLPVFVERAMHLFYQHNQHLLKKPSGPDTNPGKSSAATVSTFDVERRLFVDQALQLYLQQFMPSAED